MWKRILEPLRKKLKGENGVRLVMLLGIAGLALILLSGFLPDKAEKQTDAASVQSAETASQEQAEQYCRRMEQQLVDVLEQVEGVGSCRVMLTATGSPETIYAQDAEQEQGENRTRIQRKCVIVSDSGSQQPLVQQIAAPDSPEVIGASPLTGAANIRIPFAATQSGAAMNTFTWFFKMSQEMVFGSPHARPAMMVCISPSTMRMSPSPAAAPL